MRTSPHVTELLIAFCKQYLCRWPVLYHAVWTTHTYDICHKSSFNLGPGAESAAPAESTTGSPLWTPGGSQPFRLYPSPHLPLASVTASHEGSYMSLSCVLHESVNPNSPSSQEIPRPNHPSAVQLKASRPSKAHEQCRFGGNNPEMS